MEDLLRAIELADQQIRETRKILPIQIKNPPNPKKTTGFGTSKREIFVQKKEELSVLNQTERPKPRVLGGCIGKASRQTKPGEIIQPAIYPNYNYTKKSTPCSTIIGKRKPTQKKKQPQSKPVKKVCVQQGNEFDYQDSIATNDTDYAQFFKIKSQWDKQMKSWALQNPEYIQAEFHYFDSPQKKEQELKEPGPGSYFINHILTEKSSQFSSFPHASLPKSKPSQQNLILSPSYSLTKKNPPSVKISKDSPKSEILLKKREQEELLQEKAALIQMNEVPYIVPPIQGGVIYPQHLPKRPESSTLGPGRYFPEYSSVQPKIPGHIKLLQPEIYLKRPEHLPGPTSYDIQDTSHIPGGVISTEVRSKQPEIDGRKALDIKVQLTKKAPVSVSINPIHRKPPLPPDKSKIIGPGTYHPTHTLTQPRTDQAPVYFQQQFKTPQSDLRIPLDPNTNAVKPSIPGFKYYQPTQQNPPHLPQSIQFPGKWKFYDPIDQKFPSAPQIAFAPTEFQEFKDYEQAKQYIKKKNKRIKEKIPPVGTYDFQPVKQRAPAFDFGKAIGRTEQEYDEDELIQGDILLLEPEQKKKIPVLVNMEKQTGRDPMKIQEEKDELILHPTDYLDKKQPMLVHMDKQTGRQPLYDENQDQKLELAVNDAVTRKKTVNLVDMSKQVGREQPQEIDKSLMVVVDEYTNGIGGPGIQGYLNPNDDITRMKRPMLVNMERQTGRDFTQISQQEECVSQLVNIKHPSQPRVVLIPNFDRMTGRVEQKEPDLSPTVVTHKEAVPDLEKAYRGIEPEPKAPDFQRYTSRIEEIVEDFSEVVHIGGYVKRK